MGGPGCPGNRGSSVVRQRPIASKLSSAKPSGSIRRWQTAQLGLARCASIRSRCDRGAVPAAVFSSSGGTLAGGAGGGAPSTRSSSHLPRFTTDVRVE